MRVYFPVGFILNPERKKALIGLVMKAIERLQVDATEVFIRADLHDSTSIGGRWVPDANGFHATFFYKTAAMAAESKHVASHAYTFGGDTYSLKEAVADAPKPDTVLRKRGNVSWPPMEALEEWIEEGPAHAARTAPERARSSSNFAMGLPALNMEEELTKRKARAERFGMTEGPPTAMRDTKKAEASAQVSPRKRGREDPEKGSQKAIRRNPGDGNRNIRGGGNNTSGGGSKWNEQDRAAMEARKRRFGL